MTKDIIIQGRTRDLGGFSVQRVLPFSKKRSVGPFVFLDHMGPMHIDEYHKLDVRPHPHIGLATVTYLLEGRGMHRDTIGSKQMIEPGDLNWMTAGRGIAHSERTPKEDQTASPHKTMHGIQIWIGLPKEQEEIEPSFAHWPKESFSEVNLSETLKAKLLLGNFKDKTSPVKTLSRTLFLDLDITSVVKTQLAFSEKELAIYIISGKAKINDQEVNQDQLIIVADPLKIQFETLEKTRTIIIGGDPFPEPRYIWWNFVSSRRERIHQAAKDWTQQKFGKIAEENDFIPLPNDPLP